VPPRVPHARDGARAPGNLEAQPGVAPRARRLSFAQRVC